MRAVRILWDTPDVMGAPFESYAEDGFRKRTTTLFSGALAAGSDTTNHLSILYNRDEDGQTIAFPATEGGYLDILKVLATNKQRPFPTPVASMQTKVFPMSYYSKDDRLVVYPEPFPGETGTCSVLSLDRAEYSDPIW